MDTEDICEPRAFPALRPLAEAFHTASSLFPGMSNQRLTTLLLVVQKPGITAREIMRKAGMAQSSVSRNLAALSTGTWLDQNTKDRKPGLGLITVVSSSAETYATPTIEGRSMVSLITASL